MDALSNGAVQLLKDVLAIPSVNSRDDEGRVAEFLCDYFQKAGISAHVERIDACHANVVAELPGDKAEAAPVIWNGHLDTVPYGSMDDWNTDPQTPEEKNGRIYGRGASDMKSGLCAMAEALCRVHRSGKKPKHTILFIGTCDEEKNGIGAQDICRKYQLAPDQNILIGEPTGLKAGTAQKGCMWIDLSISGKTSHGAYPSQGCSAVEHGFAVAMQLKACAEAFGHPLLGNSTANITKISGGTAPNMIPEQCRILMDVRLTPDLPPDKLLEKLDALILEEEQRCDGNLHITYEIVNMRRSFEIDEQSHLCSRLYRCMENRGLSRTPVGISFFTDASILAKELPGAQVVLFGPGDPAMAHKANEYVEISSYLKAVDVLTDMLTE